MDFKSKHKVHLCFLHTLCTQPKGHFIQCLLCICVLIASCHITSGVEFSTCGIRSALRNIQVSDLEIRDTQPVHHQNQIDTWCGASVGVITIETTLASPAWWAHGPPTSNGSCMKRPCEFLREGEKWSWILVLPISLHIQVLLTILFNPYNKTSHYLHLTHSERLGNLPKVRKVELGLSSGLSDHRVYLQTPPPIWEILVAGSILQLVLKAWSANVLGKTWQQDQSWSCWEEGGELEGGPELKSGRADFREEGDTLQGGGPGTEIWWPQQFGDEL
jgi:hypothetical protein